MMNISVIKIMSMPIKSEVNLKYVLYFFDLKFVFKIKFSFASRCNLTISKNILAKL